MKLPLSHHKTEAARAIADVLMPGQRVCLTTHVNPDGDGLGSEVGLIHLLKAQGIKKGQIPLVSVDGGDESYRRIADPESTFIATVAIPFEEMGVKAVEAVEAIVVKKQPATAITSGPYLFMDAVVVDKNNVKNFIKK